MNTWQRDRDDYGRTVYYLTGHGRIRLEGRGRIAGVVIKHPRKRAGEPGSYWYARWDLPMTSPQAKKIVEFTNLRDAKAALEAVTA